VRGQSEIRDRQPYVDLITPSFQPSSPTTLYNKRPDIRNILTAR